MLENVIYYAFIILLIFIFYTKRKKETDKHNNPALKIYSGKYGVLLATAALFILAILKLDDPIHIKHPENSFVSFGLAILSAVATFALFRYKLVLNNNQIKIYRLFLKTRVISLSDITSLDEKHGTHQIHISNGKKYTPSNILSGHEHFFKELKSQLKISE